MVEEARQLPKFQWDYDVPDTAFWNGLDYQIGRNFLQCYTEDEISKMTFDASLGREEKLRHLRSVLQRTLAEREANTAPTPLHDADYKAWSTLKLGLSSTEHFLGDFAGQEKIAREMYENGPAGTKNMSALQQLSGIMEATGRYAEAERMAREVLPWLQAHALLGRDSPQALGSMRCLARSIWKQERYEEAKGCIGACADAIEEMGKGRFGKYHDSEKKILEDDVAELEKWREERGKE